MVSEGSGTLQFPSGAQRSFDCAGQAGPLEVDEGNWLQVRRVDAQLEVTITSPWWPEGTSWDLAVASRAGLVRRIECRSTEDGCQAPLEPEDARVMLQRDGRTWIPRWFSVVD